MLVKVLHFTQALQMTVGYLKKIQKVYVCMRLFYIILQYSLHIHIVTSTLIPFQIWLFGDIIDDD